MGQKLYLFFPRFLKANKFKFKSAWVPFLLTLPRVDVYPSWQKTEKELLTPIRMIWHKIWILCKFLSFLNASRDSQNFPIYIHTRIRHTKLYAESWKVFFFGFSLLFFRGIITRKQTSIKLHLKALTIFMAQLPFAVPFLRRRLPVYLISFFAFFSCISFYCCCCCCCDGKFTFLNLFLMIW